MAKKPRKIRVEFRKNRQRRSRQSELNRQLRQKELEDVSLPAREAIEAKGELSRRRTILVQSGQEKCEPLSPVPASADRHVGRVLHVSGALAIVEDSDGRTYTCAISRVLRTIAIESRSAVVAGDQVQFRVAAGAVSGPDIGEPQGMIERVEPRRGILARGYRGREQVIAVNVDQLLIVASLMDPPLKPNLVDRYIVAAEKGGIRSVICLNKADLVEVVDFQPFVGLYSQLGYDVLLLSARSGLGLCRLQQILRGRATLLAGQSGVGKSSLLNAIDPNLNIRIAEISQATLHGKHTTTIAQLHKLSIGGWVVDTPGIRQFELWDVIPEEVEGFFVEFRPYVALCHFGSCTHTHEQRCAVKQAVEMGEIDSGRYQRYVNLFTGEEAAQESRHE